MDKPNSDISILGIGTAVPPHRLVQEDAAQRIAEGLANLAGNGDAARWVRRIFRQTSVETRYTCLPDLLESAERSRYAPGSTRPDIPTTRERMEVYRRESVPLALEAARRALRDSGTPPSAVTHLITVSCTGFFLPGLDFELVRGLGLSPEVNRFPVTFAGCAAGLTALRLARELAAGNAGACVLAVCVELCSIHIQPSVDREDLFAASLFGDGAGACVVGRAWPEQKNVFTLDGARATLLPDTADEMLWRVGDTGFQLYLSPRIPSLIEQRVPEVITRFLAGSGEAPRWWAIHPGGRGIIDALQRAMGLSDGQTRASRDILRRYGNLSSVTILFVLEEIRRELAAKGQAAEPGIALAFGPGMQAEMVRMTCVPAGSNRTATHPEEAHAAAVP